MSKSAHEVWKYVQKRGLNDKEFKELLIKEGIIVKKPLSRTKIISHYKTFMGLEDMGLAEGDNLTIDWAESLIQDFFSSPICPHCHKYKTMQGNGIMHQLCECGQTAP